MPENAQQAQKQPAPKKWVARGPVYRRLLMEKFQAETDREKVLASIIVAMAEDLDRVAAGVLAVDRGLGENALAIEAIAEQVFGSMADATPAGAPASAPSQAGTGVRDQTPFPAGVAPTVVQNGTGPLPDDEEAPIPTPSVPQPTVNAAPIPTPSSGGSKQARNGSKAAQ